LPSHLLEAENHSLFKRPSKTKTCGYVCTWWFI